MLLPCVWKQALLPMVRGLVFWREEEGGAFLKFIILFQKNKFLSPMKINAHPLHFATENAIIKDENQ